jgi:hypothetical protein
MPDPEQLNVTAETSKPSYATDELVEFTASAKTEAGEPIYAELRWGLRFPDGRWVNYWPEYSFHTYSDTGTVTWHWPTDDDPGPPDPGEYELEIEVYASDDGDVAGEGFATVKFSVHK